jgi:hypothetical protein
MVYTTRSPRLRAGLTLGPKRKPGAPSYTQSVSPWEGTTELVTVAPVRYSPVVCADREGLPVEHASAAPRGQICDDHTTHVVLRFLQRRQHWTALRVPACST